jgi:ABC-2 type transport system permease protein
MFPVGVFVLGSIPWRSSGAGLLVVILVLGALNGGALGLALGTLVPPNRINILFALVLTPLLFTGCSQYPWPSLSRLAWFKWLTTLNPLTYISEGMRAAMVPKTPHMAPWICVTMSLVFLVICGSIGIAGFLRRAID